jgi:predicted Zn-dependent protease
VLLPEIHLRVGDLLTLLKRPVEALAHFERSMALKPDYWPAYIRLADLNVSLNRRQAAVDVLTDGLTHLPNEPRLLEALNRLKPKPTAQVDGPASKRP